MRQLIVNGDDYGLDESINGGIIRAFSEGILTSTTVLANGDAFLSGISALKSNPKLGVGVHLTLVNGRPLSPLSQVTSLVNQTGNFPVDYQEFFIRFLQGKVRLGEIKQEWAKQISQVKAQGLEITHLDSHQHLHVFPRIIDIAIELAGDFGINKIRLPGEAIFFLGGGCPAWKRVVSRNLLTSITALARRKVLKQKILTPKHFYGMLWGGNQREDKLMSILKQLPEGISEIMTHPGLNNFTLGRRFLWNYCWEEEVKALSSPRIKEILQEKGIRLISYRELNNE